MPLGRIPKLKKNKVLQELNVLEEWFYASHIRLKQEGVCGTREGQMLNKNVNMICCWVQGYTSLGIAGFKRLNIDMNLIGG